ncbi:hypothetical protein AAC387_Pa07g2125 [Persea americana]
MTMMGFCYEGGGEAAYLSNPVMAMMGFRYEGGGEAADSSVSGRCLRCIANGEREIVGTMELLAWRCL